MKSATVQFVLNAVCSALVVIAALALYDRIVVRPALLIGVVDVGEVYRAKEAEFTQILTKTALEEDRQIHFSTPPAVDESTPQTDTSGNSASPANATPAVTPPQPNKPQPAAAPSAPTPPKENGWWQKLLEWAGLG